MSERGQSGELEKTDRLLPEGLWQQLRSDPVNAPQHLALAAVERWGEQARAYAEGVRERYPDATNRELAEVVKKRHVLLARSQGAAAGVPASFAPLAGAAAAMLPDVGALAWIQSRMVMHIAAVYGHDTNHRERAAELLVLQGIYTTTEAARVALTAATKRVATRAIHRYLQGGALLLLKQLSRYVGIKFTRVGVLKLVPFVAIPLSAAVNGLSTGSLAERAIRFYDLKPRTL